MDDNGLIAKDIRHAPVAGKVLIARAYKKPSWNYKSQEAFLATDACPK